MERNRRVNIFGVLVDKVSLSETTQIADQIIQSGSSLRIAMANVAKIIKSRSDPRLREILNSADLIGADGIPLVWASRLMGDPLPGRVNGTDLMNCLLELASKRKYGVYFFGATEEVIIKVVKKVRILYPGLRVVGWRNGYFRDDEENRIVEDIIKSSPDILLVGMGTPMKEEFMYKYFKDMNIPLCHGVGGSFDVLAGAVNRAPVWMQERGLEWFYRLMKEPRRMFKRYLVTNTVFILLSTKVIFGRVLFKSKKLSQ